MDQLVQQHIENQLLQTAKALEDQIDGQLHRLDNLEEDDYDKLRQHRLKELKEHAAKRQKWLARGHGEYREIFSEKDFFAEMKGEERMVCHFFRENWPCKVMDKHLQQLATAHVETKFVKINAEKAPFLTERLKVWMLPTLALVKAEKTVDYVVGFDDLGGKDDFPTAALEARLQAAGLLSSSEQTRSATAVSGTRSVRKGGNVALKLTHSDEDSDFSD